MRIGIDARFYGGEQSKGLGRYTQKLIQYLAQIDQANEYFIFLQEEQYQSWSLPQTNFHPVKAPSRGYPVQEQLLMPWKIRKTKVDLMHFPHFNVPIFYRGKFLVTIHDLVISHFPTQRATTLAPWLYRIKQLAYKIVIRQAAKKAIKIITVSQYSKKDIINYFKLPAEKVLVTYEAADPLETKIKSDPKEVLKKYNLQRPYILYVGNAYPHKNLEILLKTVRLFKGEQEIPWQLVLVGKEDYFYNRLKQQAWARDVDDAVIFPGFVPDQDLPVLYSQALAYIFPSKYEGFGLPPLEAMLYGVPVLAAKTTCLPEILGSAALYFEPDDVYGIIKQIKRLGQDSGLRTELIKLGRAQVQKYNWQKMAEQTLEIYQKIK